MIEENLKQSEVGEQPPAQLDNFGITVDELQQLFKTESIASGKSNELLNNMGGLQELSSKLMTNLKEGLDANQSMTKRLEFYGENKLAPPALESFFHFMCKQTEDFCIRILALASLLMFGLAFVSEDPFESIVQAVSILLAILAVIIIGAVTDFRKESQFIELYMEQEREDIKYYTIVRNGIRRTKQNHNTILVGDIVEIIPGDALSFDGILIKGSTYIEVDESMITGLSDCIKKRPINSQQKSNQHEECFLRAGSNIFEGFGSVLVCAVGERTYSSEQKNQGPIEKHVENTPLQNSTTILAKYLVFIGCMCATFMFIVLELYMIRELKDLKAKIFSQLTLRKILSDFIEAFLIIVLSIPEGLPLIVTLSMAFSIGRLKDQGVIVRNLHGCQILGSVNVICFDKTGTLTCNNVATRFIYLGGQSYEVGDKDNHVSVNLPLFRILTEAIISNNTSQVQQQDGDSKIHMEQHDPKVTVRRGNRIDVALMNFLDVHLRSDFVEEYQKVITGNIGKVINQSEDRNNYSAAYVKEVGQRHRIYLKGKPLDILKMCDKMGLKLSIEFQQYQIYEKGDEYSPQRVAVEPINGLSRDDIESQINHYAQNSLKCTAFAYKDTFFNDQSNLDTQLFEATDFTFIGLACVRDDVREDAGSTIRTLQEALIDVKMITGDTRINAVNVAKQLSMITSEVADGEFERKSEVLISEVILNKSSFKQSEERSLLGGKGICQSQTSDDKNPFQQKIQENIQSTIRTNPLVLNFEEYLIKVRAILKSSDVYYKHKVITQENCVSLIKEIKEDQYSQEKIAELNRDISLVADASQYQKQQFLQMLIEINECTIAYVGDGNNDARSLRTAQIGMTPGKTATNVAKECSGIILMKDRLTGIGASLGWGRNIFLNIKRFIYFQLSFYFTSIMIMIISSITFKQQPFSVLQVIWLALVQDIFSAIALSTEVPQKTIFAITRPFKKNENLIDAYLLKIISAQFIYQGIMLITMLFLGPIIFEIEPSFLHSINEIGGEYQAEWAVHFTMVFHITALFQIVNLTNARRIGPYEYNPLDGILDNRPFIYMLIILICVQQSIIYYGGSYFKTAPLSLLQNLSCCLISLGSLLAFWVGKSLFSESYFKNFKTKKQ